MNLENMTAPLPYVLWRALAKSDRSEEIQEELEREVEALSHSCALTSTSAAFFLTQNISHDTISQIISFSAHPMAADPLSLSLLSLTCPALRRTTLPTPRIHDGSKRSL